MDMEPGTNTGHFRNAANSHDKEPDMTNTKLNIPARTVIRPGLQVRIIRKNDQRSGSLTEGTVDEILTNSAFHPHGIKVRLTDGTVGRVQEICGPKPN
jgi:uncharacterized repeat protein (TIGR03833 family)